jgi:oligoribonuclease NrnB/cAMP/cGMP phosphodiesterase (DHH superfamily)
MTGKNMSKTALIYHDKCNDGFCSMCIAMEKFKDPLTFRFPAAYHQEEKIFNALDYLKNKDVVFVDFAIAPEMMDKLLVHVNSVKVIDHHKTTLEKYASHMNDNSDMQGFTRGVYNQKCELILDMNRSGALMTWDYYFDTQAPRMVRYISDGDLYQFKDENTIPFLSRLSAEKYDKKLWVHLLHADDKEIDSMVREGVLLARQFDSMCQSFAENAKPIRIEINGQEFFGDLALCSGSSAIRSRAGELIYDKNGTFAALVSKWTPEEVSVSLRSSNKSDYNVRKIAEFFGGGGHDSASAFRVSMEVFNAHFSYLQEPRAEDQKKFKP